MKKDHKKELKFDGKLITKYDPALISTNFRQLTNMRYVENHIRSVYGMTKINSTALTYPKIRSGIHFKKPSETHVLVQSYNSGLTASKIYDNKTAIPSAGNFESTAIYTPDTSGSYGRWSIAPDGDVAYCNGEESCIYGGSERGIGGFINYDPSGSFSYDYTIQASNELTDSKNIVTLNSVSAGIDANVMALFHFNSDLTDSSPTTPHTATGHSITYNPGAFGTYGANFDGSSSYITIPDDADFDLSGGIFSIDLWAGIDSLTSDNTIYYQETDANNAFRIYINTSGKICVSIKSGGTEQLNGTSEFKSVGTLSVGGAITHIEVTENGDDWYIFIDGALQGYLSDSSRCADYTGLVNIGYGGAAYYEGTMDEFRISNTARHTSDFTPLSTEYSSSSTSVSIYLGFVRPVDGFKLTKKTANTSTSTMSVSYYNGAWTSVTNLSDGTSSGGVSLAQTGSVTFDSTSGVAKVKYIEGVVIYWYKIEIDAVSANTSISHATGSCPFQTIKDIWDGSPRNVESFQTYTTTYNDKTLSVRENTYPYSTTDTQNMTELDSLTTSQYIVAGFSERQTAINIRFVSGHVNTTSGTILTIEYWNGTAWTSLSIDDGTLEGGISFSKSGTISWAAPDSSGEFVKSISNDAQLYYYKLSFSKNLSSDVQVYYVNGIAAQNDIKPYKFPLYAQDRLFLCRKNTLLCSAEGTSSVFNGDDSLEITIGDKNDLMAGAWIYTQFGSNLYNAVILFKEHQTWALIGNTPDEWTKYKISDKVGCIAPETVAVVDINNIKTQEGNSRAMVVWQGADGIYLSGGRTPILISDDIGDIFDKQSSTAINSSMVTKSIGSYDPENAEYHWCYADGSSTTLNKEAVYSFKKNAWFFIDRTSDLQYMINVTDTYGNTYTYGMLNTGYMERLEYGNTFDGTAITSTAQFGDIALLDAETSAEYHGLVAVAKTVTSNKIAVTHYGDGKTTGDSWEWYARKSGYRLLLPVYHKDLTALFHSWKFVMIANNETIGFEPLYFTVIYSPVRDHMRDWRT